MATPREIVSTYLASFATADPDAVAACVTAGFVNEHLSTLGTGSVGRDEYRRRLPGFLSTFVGIRYVVVDLAELVTVERSADDRSPTSGGVVVRYRLLATYEGAPVDISGVMWFEVVEGLVARRTDVWDSLTFLRQTGQAD